MNYDEAVKIAKSGRNGLDKKIAHNTWARFDQIDKSVAVVLHNTAVLTFLPDGSIVLNSGGWLTVTTKERINRYLPNGLRVYSNRGVWWLYKNGATVEKFEDGMVISDKKLLTT